MKKKLLFAGCWLLACIALPALFMQTDYFARHFGYGSDEKIHFYVMNDGELLPGSEYTITGGLDADPVKMDRRGYYAVGEYGQYGFKLDYNGRTAHFYLENVNDWWRTSVVLNIDGDRISQLNIIYNTDGKYAESRLLSWDS